MICENPAAIKKPVKTAVQTVNGKNGPLVTLTAADVGAAAADSVLPYVLAGGMGAVINKEGQSVNLVQVDIHNAESSANAPYIFGVEDPSLLVGSPYTGGPFYGFRQIIFGGHLVTAVIIELYPMPGRIWGNTYDHNAGTWYGWHGTTMQ